MPCCFDSVAQAVGYAVLAVVAVAAVRRLLFAGVLWRWHVPADGKAVVITGCDSGFGRQLAEELYRRGFFVVAACLTRDGVGQLTAFQEATRTAQGGGLHAVLCDVTSDDDVAALAASTREALAGRPLYAVVNNAGITAGMLVDITPVSVFERVANVNYLGMVRVCKATLPLLMANRGSRIINLTSIAGSISSPLMAPYCASKFAATSFTDVLRLEMAPFGVKVILVQPGFFRTPLVEDGPATMTRAWNAATDAERSRWGQPFFDRVVRRSSHVLKGAGNPGVVVDALVHALTCRFPRVRYRVGNDARFVFQPMSMLPHCVLDRIVGFVTRAGTPADAKR